jgi:aspartyl-tRNA(Asn)/glutamyl-tRNA(Gln) amidotransferase subunit C
MITPDIVASIAKLARIELSPEEAATLEKDLAGILQFVATLNEADTASVEPMAGGTTIENAMRQDSTDQNPPSDRDELLGQFPKRSNDYLSVRAVFDRS